MWHELELPHVVALRRQFFDEADRHLTLPGSITDSDWMAQIPRAENRPPPGTFSLLAPARQHPVVQTTGNEQDRRSLVPLARRYAMSPGIGVLTGGASMNFEVRSCHALVQVQA